MDEPSEVEKRIAGVGGEAPYSKIGHERRMAKAGEIDAALRSERNKTLEICAKLCHDDGSIAGICFAEQIREMIENEKSRSNACNIPPSGWRCARGAGHTGPCAAEPDPPKEIAEKAKAYADEIADAMRRGIADCPKIPPNCPYFKYLDGDEACFFDCDGSEWVGEDEETITHSSNIHECLCHCNDLMKPVVASVAATYWGIEESEILTKLSQLPLGGPAAIQYRYDAEEARNEINAWLVWGGLKKITPEKKFRGEAWI